MSKKDFIALADMIRANRADFSEEAIERIAEFCRNQNPRFKRERWYGYINGDCEPCGGTLRPKNKPETLLDVVCAL